MSNAMYAFESPEKYLELHYKTLKEDRFFVHDGEISVFRKDPLEFYGSTTVTKGIKVEA